MEKDAAIRIIAHRE